MSDKLSLSDMSKYIKSLINFNQIINKDFFRLTYNFDVMNLTNFLSTLRIIKRGRYIG